MSRDQLLAALMVERYGTPVRPCPPNTGGPDTTANQQVRRYHLLADDDE